MNCAWLEDNKLKNAVLDSLKNEAKLATPLNMREFAKATNNIVD
jgi:hypothetical protein